MSAAGAGKTDRIAVALRYGIGDAAPIVTAKGRGELAERIIATAEDHDVAVEENPVLAQALAQVELEEHIPVALYKAVAEVIGFVMRTGRLTRPDQR